MKKIIVCILMFFCLCECIFGLYFIIVNPNKSFISVVSMLITLFLFIGAFVFLFRFSKRKGYFNKKEKTNEIIEEKQVEVIEETPPEEQNIEEIQQTEEKTQEKVEIVEEKQEIQDLKEPTNDLNKQIIKTQEKPETIEIKEETLSEISQKLNDLKITMNENYNKLHSIPKPNNIFNNELSKAIFLYSQNKRKVRENHEYQQYLYYRYGIGNPKQYHIDMINKGYFELLSTQDVLSSLKVNKLKEILGNYDLEIKGRKKDLIQRILNNINEEELKRILPKDEIYCLSRKGLDYIELYNDYIQLHKHLNWQIDFYEYDEERSKFQNDIDFYVIAENILKRKLENSNIIRIRSISNELYQLYREQEKYDQAVYYLLLSFYFDLNGMDNYQFIKFSMDKKELIKETDWLKLIFSSGILELLYDLKEYYNENILDEIYDNYKLPINCCSKETLKQLMKDLYKEKRINKTFYRNLLKENYISFVQSI